MISLDDVAWQNRKQLNPNWQQIPDHSKKILISGACRSRKTNALLSSKNDQHDIDKLCLYDKGT